MTVLPCCARVGGLRDRPTRLGGLRLYQRLRPSFFGLFLGGTTALLLANAIRLLTEVPGQAG